MGKSSGGNCVMMTGPDVRMDQCGDYDQPCNPLPVKCPRCTFPDLDYVGRPYLLAKGFASPAETAPAEVGNFLVRERVKKILEVAAPGACAFYPTAERRTKPTEWWLAVPKRIVSLGKLPLHEKQRCSKCGEPKVGYLFYEKGRYIGLDRVDCSGMDVFKSLEWSARSTAEDDLAEINRYRKQDGMEPLPWSDYGIEPPDHPQRWTRLVLERDLFFSVRLDVLLKKAKVKGQLVRKYDFREVKPTEEDEVWIEEKLQLLAKAGLVSGVSVAKGGKKAAGKEKAAAERWFRGYLKRNAKKGAERVDFAAVEKKRGVRLPQDYKDFIATVGPKSFEDVMDVEGFTANILPPQKLEFGDYRRGKLKKLVGEIGEEMAQVDGVLFSDTDHGDAFILDMAAGDGDWPVYWYDHEQNTLEAFAGSFAECVRRFAERT